MLLYNIKLTNPHLYTFSYKGGGGFYIKAKKSKDWKEIYGDNLIENTPQPHEYYIQSGLYETSIARDGV